MTRLRASWVFAVAVLLATSCRDLCQPNPCTRVPGLSVCRVERGQFSCGCDETAWEDDGAGACRPLTADWTGAPDGVVDWSAQTPTYTADLHLIGPQNQALQGSVVIGALRYDTDERGEVRVGDLPARESVVAQVRAPGHVNATRVLTLGLAGYQPLRVRLTPVQVQRDLSAAESTELVSGPAAVRLNARTLVDAQGNPYDGTVRVKLAAWDLTTPGFSPAEDSPGPRVAATRDGGLVAVGRGAAVSVTLETPAGAPLQLDPRATATVSLALPKTSPLDAGVVLPLFRLDDAAGVWREDGACTVQPSPAALAERPLTCVGDVRHFSVYLLNPWTDTQSTFFAYVNACLRVLHDVTLPLALPLHHVESAVEECSHLEGEPCTAWEPGFLFPSMDAMLPPPSGAPTSAAMYCSAGVRQTSYRWSFQVGARTLVATEEHRLRSTLYAKVGNAAVPVAEVFTPLDLTTLLPISSCLREPCLNGSVQQGTATVSQLCLGQVPNRSCNTLRVKLELKADGTTVGAVLGATDADKDGYPALSGGPLPGARYDCRDTDATVHPNAREVPCNGKDDDCNGAPDSTTVTQAAFSSADDWNRQCAALTCKTVSAEVPGNRWDEDCDGFATDMDGDGVKVRGDPTPGLAEDDCNDACAACRPRAAEVTGNTLDENCDGFAIDPDGDGFASPLHFEATTLPLTDCDDTNPRAFPTSDAGEATVARFFVEDGGVVVRTAAFCALFDAVGNPTAEARRTVFADVNCDGYASDLDGDGWTVPGDTRLGAGRAFDCNDLDPRVVPEGGGYSADSVRPACVDPFRPGASPSAVNESSCAVNLERFGGAARFVCPNAPHGGTNACEDVVDQHQVSWGVFACNAKDWGLGDPLRPLAFGRAWGPCDFGVRLPACEATTQCSGRPGAFSAAYRERLARSGYVVDATAWVGTCLPMCGDRCHPNVCAVSTPTCSLESRQAVCR